MAFLANELFRYAVPTACFLGCDLRATAFLLNELFRYAMTTACFLGYVYTSNWFPQKQQCARCNTQCVARADAHMRCTKGGGMGGNAVFFVGLVHLRTRPQKTLAGRTYVDPVPRRDSDPPRLENPGSPCQGSVGLLQMLFLRRNIVVRVLQVLVVRGINPSQVKPSQV